MIFVRYNIIDAACYNPIARLDRSATNYGEGCRYMSDVTAKRRQGTIEDSEFKRLRWRCRRGLLENDLVLERFLDVYGTKLSAGQLEAFSKLLDLEDKQIRDLVSRRREPGDRDLAEVVELLRSCWRGEQERRT